ncbi:aldose 1-epimerase [Chitinophaga costaii]|uniref:Aldose 1-epimerase n=1 Tax=Chitinophaga costaii TaxID=1335309 RepID=A0A1C3ZDQ7_9BACT|nr:aldose 1-epimerase [Chitinophaga costaii]
MFFSTCTNGCVRCGARRYLEYFINLVVRKTFNVAFSISPVSQEGLDIIVLKDNSTGTEVQVVPAHGAMLHAFVVQHKGQPLNVIDSYKNIAALKADLTNSFKNVKLSPFACRMTDRQYNWNGQHYEILKSDIHGLLFDVSFELVQQTAIESYAAITLQYTYRADDAGYPFNYDCLVEYRLLPEHQLAVTTTLENHSHVPIPIMDGWHPYFTTGGSIDALELQFAATHLVAFNEKLLPTGQLLPYDKFRQRSTLTGVELDNSFLRDLAKPAPAAGLYDPEKGLAIEFYPDASYPVLQVYTPPHRRSIAVECLSGAPDAFNNKIGLVQLSPGESKTFRTTYKIRQ